MNVKQIIWLAVIGVVMCGIEFGISLFFKMYFLSAFWIIIMLYFSNSVSVLYEIINEEANKEKGEI